jgi:uncharacterized protein
MQEASTASLVPISSAERIRGVDIARGIALLGILLVNVRFFFAPLAFAIDPTIELPGIAPSYADDVAWSFVEIFCSYKFISLFSILFGFGLAMQADRARHAGQSRWGSALRRLGLLLGIGLLHGLLVWYGDILTLYALLGVVVVACARLSPRVLLVAALVTGGISLLASIGSAVATWVVASFPEPFDPPELVAEIAAMEAARTAEVFGEAGPRGWQAMLDSNFDVRSDAWMAGEIVAMRDGPFLDALLFRTANFAMSYVAALFGYGWHALSMMLLGVAALRSGLFGGTPDASRRRRRIACIGLLVGFPIATIAPAAYWIGGFESNLAPAVHVVALEIGALILPMAYACAIVEWGPRLPRFLAVPLERTGRMSLTVYLGESLACTALASWWGLALFGTMSDAQFTWIAPAVWLGLAAFATLWLQRFRIGPMEWVWRSATYARNPA